jgi:predicted transposase YbfD/YdcC
MIVLYGSASGCGCIASCQQKAKSNLNFFSTHLDLKRIPDQTTIIRVLKRIGVHHLTAAVEKFLNSNSGFVLDPTLSVDGKTLCAVHGVKVRHILSLLALKSNCYSGDAIFAQKDICQSIVEYGGDYLFRLKDNQEQLKLEVSELFAFNLLPTQSYHAHLNGHGRREVIQVEVSSDLDIFRDNLRLNHIGGWDSIKTIGKITTTSKRLKGIDGYGGTTSYQTHTSTTYFISSKQLLAGSAYNLVKSHWGIENHLHRHKDMIFMEDRQTLRSGFAHEVMTFIRSFCIYLLYQVSPLNLAQGFRQFNNSPRLMQNYFRKALLI